MKITLYHLKNCDTCKKAIKSLEQAGHEISLIDVRSDGISKSDISELMQAVGWRKLLNTRSTTWRNLDEIMKSKINEIKALELMHLHPTLLKRPIIKTRTNTTCGWTPDIRNQLL